MKIQHVKTWGKQKNTLKSFTGLEKNNRPKSPPQLGSLSVQYSRSVVSDFVTPWIAACPSPAPGAYSNSCPLSRWCPRAIQTAHKRRVATWREIRWVNFTNKGEGINPHLTPDRKAFLNLKRE